MRLQLALDNISALAGGEGLSLGVAFQDGHSLQLGSGLINRAAPQNVKPESLFAFGSTTKMFTAASIVRLVQLNHFQLDSKAFPLMDTAFRWFSEESLLKYFPHEYMSAVTVRQLLDMSSGIIDLTDAAVAVQQRKLSADISPRLELKLTWDTLCNHHHASKNCMFACAPGTCRAYSSINYILLGLILAQHADVSNYYDLDQAAALGPGFAALRYCERQKDDPSAHACAVHTHTVAVSFLVFLASIANF